MIRSTVIIGLGSNIGDRLSHLTSALNLLSSEGDDIKAVSSVWETAPWGFEADNKFFNLVAVLETSREPRSLLSLMRSVEGRLGRKRSMSGRYESRIIDIDILLWEEKIISVPGLEVPHPHLAGRRFVLEPLCEVAPGAVHPITGLTAKEMLAGCDDMTEVKLFRRAL